MDYKIKNREKKRQQIAFRRFLTGANESYTIRQYVSLNYLEAKKWIESQWLPEMNWNNYGSFWVVDHIIPLRLFNIFDENDLKIAWNYHNLMPLLKIDNLHKEGGIRISKIILERKEQTFIVKKLLEKANEIILYMDKVYVKNVEHIDYGNRK